MAEGRNLVYVAAIGRCDRFGKWQGNCFKGDFRDQSLKNHDDTFAEKMIRLDYGVNLPHGGGIQELQLTADLTQFALCLQAFTAGASLNIKIYKHTTRVSGGGQVGKQTKLHNTEAWGFTKCTITRIDMNVAASDGGCETMCTMTFRPTRTWWDNFYDDQDPELATDADSSDIGVNYLVSKDAPPPVG